MEKSTRPLPVSFDESRWGRLLAWEKLVPGVYEFCSKRDEGYLIDKEESKGIISESTYPYGVESSDGTCVYFNYDHGKHVILYEITLFKLLHCDATEKKALQDELMSNVLYGAEEYSTYFGAWVPQPNTPWGPRHRYIPVDNGIWFVQTNGKWVLSLCHVLSEGLEDFPRSLAQGNRGIYPDLTWEDMYWELEDCAPVIHNLMNEDVCPSIEKFITSIQDLHACLCECFPAYTTAYNKDIETSIEVIRKKSPDADISQLESEKIKKMEGASIYFLKIPKS